MFSRVIIFKRKNIVYDSYNKLGNIYTDKLKNNVNTK
jgi:hypothetical protein